MANCFLMSVNGEWRRSHSDFLGRSPANSFNTIRVAFVFGNLLENADLSYP